MTHGPLLGCSVDMMFFERPQLRARFDLSNGFRCVGCAEHAIPTFLKIIVKIPQRRRNCSDKRNQEKTFKIVKLWPSIASPVSCPFSYEELHKRMC